MDMELRGTLKTVRGKAGRGDSPAPSYEVVVIVSSTAAAAELLPFIGHDLALSVEPLERLLYNSTMRQRDAGTPLEDAVNQAEPHEAGTNGTASNGEVHDAEVSTDTASGETSESEEAAPRRRRRATAATADANTGP